MATTFRVGSFNLENLFERPKVLNLKSNEDTRQLLNKIADLEGLLAKANYTAAVKTKILSLYGELKPYITPARKLHDSITGNRSATCASEVIGGNYGYCIV